MDTDDILLDSEDRMDKCVADFAARLKNVRTGQASVEMVEHVHVDIPDYGGALPLKQVALISKSDMRMLTIKPFDAKTIKEIEKGILAANLGLTPISDGRVIRLNFPAMTEENRKKAVKLIKEYLEQHKVSLRNVRHDAMKHLKAIQKNISEDAEKKAEADVNELIKTHETQLDEHFEKKSKEIMTI
ncbi:MAG: ribosome recycling factor [Planctomycetota bacterium]